MTVLDIVIGVALATAVMLYLRGWQRQAQAGSGTLLSQPGRIFTFALASLLLAGALFSPLHSMAARYFSFHVLQRLLFISLIPLCFLSGNPWPILHAGLPRRFQEALQQLPQNAPSFYSILMMAMRPLLVWFMFAATFWLWHDVQLNQLLLQNRWLHRLENLTLVGTAVLYWWHILAVSPRLHSPLPLLWRVGYAALGASPIKLVGLVLLFSGTAVYEYPAELHLNTAALDITDQSLGAGLVWVFGGIVFTWTAVLLMRDWLKDEDDKPKLPESVWSTEEAMLAPGFGNTSAYAPPSK
ncbi:cytochrome c oxidase assembly protein [Candidatus Leptofilum sp.]|uniref:cytochrome c oxidase assembly protein n=1 Tax=Candidatus Leptofilum sp. TaxID=3241576 RepID=UPI003B5C628B